MKAIRFISTGVLLLLFGVFVPINAQQEQHGQDAKAPKQEQKAKPQQQQQRAQQQPQGQTNQQPQRAQQQQPEQNKGQQQRAQQQPQANRPSTQGQRVQQGQERVVWQQHRAHSWQTEHRDWQQRGGYSGYRIPEDHFLGSFGPSHAFRIYSYPLVILGGYPRFQYGGFWFSVVDPWPEYWSDDWYDNDDVYIDYSGDGYYLYNRRYPQDRIAVMVYLD